MRHFSLICIVSEGITTIRLQNLLDGVLFLEWLIDLKDWPNSWVMVVNRAQLEWVEFDTFVNTRVILLEERRVILNIYIFGFKKIFMNFRRLIKVDRSERKIEKIHGELLIFHPIKVPICDSSEDDINNLLMREIITRSPPSSILTPPRRFPKSAEGLIHSWIICPSFWLNGARSFNWELFLCSLLTLLLNREETEGRGRGILW